MSREQWLSEMSESLGVEPEDVIEVAAMFFDAIDERLNNIESAYRAGDIKELTRLAHGLKGDAANMRFQESSLLARELELQGRSGRVDDFDRRFQALCEAVEKQKRTIGLDAGIPGYNPSSLRVPNDEQPT